jgi:hypothetical protein
MSLLHTQDTHDLQEVLYAVLEYRQAQRVLRLGIELVQVELHLREHAALADDFRVGSLVRVGVIIKNITEVVLLQQLRIMRQHHH